MSISLKIAIRFLKSGRGQTVLIALGIAIGVSVQVFLGSLIQGLQKSLINTTVGNSSHITIKSTTEDKLIGDYDRLVRYIDTKEKRVLKISPVLDQPAFINYNDKSESIIIRGVVFNEADKIYNFKGRLIAGTMPVKDFEAVIGKELQKELKVNLGDKLEITIPEGLKQEFTITGVFDLKVQSINKSWFLTSLPSAQALLDMRGKVTAIEMQIDSSKIFTADTVSNDLKGLNSKGDLKITNWKEENEQLLSGLNGQSVSSYMIQLFVIISVVLGIASVLAISVIQKSKQIGILKAMGIKNSKASRIFFYQGLILGAIGGILGIMMGLGLAYSFTVFARNPDGTPIVALSLDPAFFAISFIIAVIASSLAALVPARKSSKLDPIEVIRNG
ncbi:MAG: ABC transporter permease [Solirubrobacterales bacterium]